MVGPRKANSFVPAFEEDINPFHLAFDFHIVTSSLLPFSIRPNHPSSLVVQPTSKPRFDSKLGRGWDGLLVNVIPILDRLYNTLFS